MREATLISSGDKPVLRFERFLPRPVEEVWRAVTDPVASRRHRAISPGVIGPSMRSSMYAWKSLGPSPKLTDRACISRTTPAASRSPLSWISA